MFRHRRSLNNDYAIPGPTHTRNSGILKALSCGKRWRLHMEKVSTGATRASHDSLRPRFLRCSRGGLNDYAIYTGRVFSGVGIYSMGSRNCAHILSWIVEVD